MTMKMMAKTKTVLSLTSQEEDEELEADGNVIGNMEAVVICILI